MFSAVSWPGASEFETGPGDSVRCACSCGFVWGRSCDIRDAPHISHESREGWFKNVHRGHWKVALGSAGFCGPPLMFEAAGHGGRDPVSSGLVDVDRGRIVREPTVGLDGATGVRLVALEMEAFSTWANVGLMPQARHGGKGV